MPVSSCSVPIGRWTATQRSESCERMPSRRAEEIGALAVEHVDEDHARVTARVGALPEARGADLHAHHRGDDDERSLHDPQSRDRVALEPGIARRVDQVDLASLPLEVGQRGLERHLAALLVGIPVGRGARLDRPEPVDRPGLEEHRLDQRGLADVRGAR